MQGTNIYILKMNVSEFMIHYDNFVGLFAENTRGHFKDEVINDDYILEKCNELKYYLSIDKAHLFGAFYDNVLIGFLWAHPKTFVKEPRLYIYSLILSEKYRGLKIGSKLMTSFEEYAKSIGINSVDVSTATFKTDAIAFYEKLGYKPERIYLKKDL